MQLGAAISWQILLAKCFSFSSAPVPAGETYEMFQKQATHLIVKPSFYYLDHCGVATAEECFPRPIFSRKGGALGTFATHVKEDL